jgi:hypothetical protein
MEQIKTSFDFEKPLAELVQQIDKVKQVADKTKVDMPPLPNWKTRSSKLRPIFTAT